VAPLFAVVSKGQPGGVEEVLLHGELRQQMVLLWNQADPRTRFVLGHRDAIDGDAPETRLRAAGQQIEQGGFP